MPGTPENPDELRVELKKHTAELTVVEGLSLATNTTQKEKGQYFLLELDLQKRLLRTRAFQANELNKAQDAYLEAEKKIRDNPLWQSVLVSVDNISELRKAYPNFFLDIKDFATGLKSFL